MPSGSGSPDPRIGQVLAERYRLESRLGGGGMGTVYAATQLALGGRRVAVKLIRHDRPGDASDLARFRLEADLASQLRHPNTVRVFDFGESESGELFLVTELLEGETLGELLRRESALSPSVAVEIIGQVLGSLSEAHNHGIVHRDIKPDNIFLLRLEGGRTFAKLMDFGIARAASGESTGRLTETGALIGTPAFMSPEQIEGRPLDGRSDLYSIGVLLYRMVAGRLPFEHAAPTAMLLAHLGEPVPPIGWAYGTPLDGLEATIVACLEKSVEHRPGSAEALRVGLDALLGSEPSGPLPDVDVDVDGATVGRGLIEPTATPAQPPAVSPPGRPSIAWGALAGGLLLTVLAASLGSGSEPAWAWVAAATLSAIAALWPLCLGTAVSALVQRLVTRSAWFGPGLLATAIVWTIAVATLAAWLDLPLIAVWEW